MNTGVMQRQSEYDENLTIDYNTSIMQKEEKYLHKLMGQYYQNMWSSILSKEKFFVSLLTVEELPFSVLSTQDKSKTEDIFKLMMPALGQSELPNMLFNILAAPDLKRSKRYISIRRWEGEIKKIEENYFWARLEDRFGDLSDKLGKFPLQAVGDGDLEKISIGARFYWNIGYKISESGVKESVSKISFQRLPRLTNQYIEDARKRAAIFKSKFNFK